MKILKSLEETDLLTNDISETIQNEAEKQKGFLGLLYGTLGASLLGNLLTGKGVKRPKFSNIPSRGVIRWGEETIRAGEETIRAGQDF